MDFSKLRLDKIVLPGILILLGAIYLQAAEQDGEEPAEGPAVKRVRVATALTAEDRREVRFSGITRAASRARLAFTLGGRLVARPVEVGDAVKAGQLLARLDAREPQNAVAAARAAHAELATRLAQAERDRARVAELHAGKAATREELEKTAAAADSLAAAAAAAQARLAEAERLLAECELRAPFAGDVVETLLEPGENALPGRAVVVLAGSGGIEVEVEVPESVIAHVTPGEAVKVRLPAVGVDDVSGHVASLGRTAAGPGRLFPVIVALDDHAAVAAGMTAEVVLGIANGEGLALPVAAVVNPGGRRPAVYRVRDGKVEKLRVEVGALLGDRVIVRTAAGEPALMPGDLVVVGGQLGLVDGETVEVVG